MRGTNKRFVIAAPQLALSSLAYLRAQQTYGVTGWQSSLDLPGLTCTPLKMRTISHSSSRHWPLATPVALQIQRAM